MGSLGPIFAFWVEVGRSEGSGSCFLWCFSGLWIDFDFFLGLTDWSDLGCLW